jgi:hypothetical protein
MTLGGMRAGENTQLAIKGAAFVAVLAVFVLSVAQLGDVCAQRVSSVEQQVSQTVLAGFHH